MLTSGLISILPDGRRIMLEPQALKDCLNGRMSFMASFCQCILNDIDLDIWDSDVGTRYAIPCDTCTDVPTCTKDLTDLFAVLIRLGVTSRPIPMPKNFQELCDLYRSRDATENLFCDQCIARLQVIFEENRKAMWADFPLRIGLPAWREIRDFDS